MLYSKEVISVNDFITLSSDIGYTLFNVLKYGKFIFATVEIFKKDGSTFSLNRTTLGTIKSNFCPYFDVFQSIVGEKIKGSYINTYGSIFILRSGIIYIDRAIEDVHLAQSFSITLMYPLQ